jgi:hypothetical protein
LNANDGVLFSWMGPKNFTSADQAPFIPLASPANNGIYHVRVTSDKGCTSTDSTVVQVDTRPVVNAGSDAAVCEGSGIQLHSSQNNNVVLFFVVHVSMEHGTNPFISKYLIRYPQASTAGIVEIRNGRCTRPKVHFIRVGALQDP